MKVLLRSKTQVATRFIAWKSPDDPSTGDFSCSGDPALNFQIFIWHGTRPYYRFIKLDSVSVTGAAYLHNTTSFAYETVVNTKDESSIEYTTSDDSPYTRVMIDYMGNFRFMSWNSSLSSWTVVTQLPAATGCDTYGLCGPFGYCDLMLAVPSCQCLDGFEPVDSNASSTGCRRKQQLRCGDDHFVIMYRMKVPDKFLHVQNRNFDECMDECTHNCSCTAYAYTNLTATGIMSNQPRCLLWTGELSDTARDIRNIIGENLYLRLADSIGIQQNKGRTKTPVVQQLSTIHDLWDQNMELPCISFEDITAATDSFHETNMLGKGGFGKVYKVGTLEDGKEIAVKRLSKSSEQGTEQFRNELVLIAKLQHKNLVRLLGCCIHGDEKLLIYEYLPNKSLDKFIFNHTRGATLDWPTRFNIIKGVARGILYLHQDSRMTIIHRDLKASNILLDAEMNPKISDFGMARIFGGNEQQESTTRVVGTYGYMSPEYAMEGIFSVKSDTYSFGEKRNNENQNRAMLGNFRASHEVYEKNQEFPCINFEDVVTATNNFSDSNMLGEGGFGKVYKGKLEGGKEVAVKRLSTGSTQGVEHFTNEVVLIAKLQHKNLVRLIGCCIHGDEKLLIYEYLPNKSLDHFLFDPANKFILDWPTSGYMSPEYAMDGVFSVKSDIYSFGVILLEIVSGLKISLPQLMDFPNLLAYAWRLWKDDKTMDLMDSSIAETFPTHKRIYKRMITLHVVVFMSLICFSQPSDRLTPAKPLIFPGDDKLISDGGVFALGFFSLTNSTPSLLYLGIWYNNIPERTYVWIANRDNPITTPSAKLAVTNTSDLVLSDSKGLALWSTSINGTIRGSSVGERATAELRNTGNFVLWVNYKKHVAVQVVAWKGPQDPSTGDFSLSGDPSQWGIQLVVWHGSIPSYRTEVWTGAPVYDKDISTQVIDNGEEIYETYSAADGLLTHWKVDYTGNVFFRRWDNQSSSWEMSAERPGHGCLQYGACGPFGYCDVTGSFQECKCFDGFELADGLSANFSKGCRRKEALKCSGGEDHFLTLPGMKVPDKFLYIRNISFEECTDKCNRNCSCTAYAYANWKTDITMGDISRCLVWTGELLDSGKGAPANGENLYLRLSGSRAVNKKNIVKTVLPAIACMLILTAGLCVVLCKRKSGGTAVDDNYFLHSTFFEDITSATNGFHDTNMLGKGGFGKVYKGTLEDGMEIAVKRLEKDSAQGVEHFRNEVVLIAKLQHKNLVRLLGCCIRGDEKLLIYEYLPNKSLDKFLFDHAMKSVLDWPTRFNIIKGVARGLLYLHQDSRMMIIHRDLKTSNILLDAEMNPKISDFGMARIFGNSEQQASTKRVVGTYGYMAPEYAMEGIFSVKSDTYSFGVLILEIVSGLKISSPHHIVMDFPNLIAYAWNLWKDGMAEAFVDKMVLESCLLNEVLQCIHIGLLCVQDSPNARPHMSLVVSMLDNEDMARPIPKQPIYFVQRHYDEEERQGSESSVNNASLTALEGR
uniref:non-specific serine/threonine protein kinase n=1 Tax=Oryza meridionalis TaxID=40149 RepID=A0A0E0DIS6_9ORYZ